MTKSSYREMLKDPRWQRKRLEIMQRDDWTCRHCGDNRSELQVHHLSYGETPWGVEDSELITLCRKCHQFEHDEYKFNAKSLTEKEFLRQLAKAALKTGGGWHIAAVIAAVEEKKYREYLAKWSITNDFNYEILRLCIREGLILLSRKQALDEEGKSLLRSLYMRR